MHDQISTRHRKVVDCILETPGWTWGAFALNHTAHQISEMFRVADPDDLEAEPIDLKAWFTRLGKTQEDAHGDDLPRELILLQLDLPGFDDAYIAAHLGVALGRCLALEADPEKPSAAFIDRYLSEVDRCCADLFGYGGIPIFGIRRLMRHLRALAEHSLGTGWYSLPADRLHLFTVKAMRQTLYLPVAVLRFDPSFWLNPKSMKAHSENHHFTTADGFGTLLLHAKQGV